MTLLTVWPDDQPGHVVLRTEDFGAIVAELRRVGAGFARWPLLDGSDEDWLARYREVLDARVGGDCSVEVAAGEPSLVERRWGGVEERFFVQGAAVWYLHAGREVHAVLCEPGDVLTVPAGVSHWHDGGLRAGYVTVRVRRGGGGCRGGVVRAVEPGEFPGFEELVAGRGGGAVLSG
ncbi:cupin [Amycolatopsis sp. GA6-003]|uniref:cupin n=1 Tax=Amycolatopsis sp. GA6-003 TaxID=2652444 RepID=UPI00391707CF